MATVALSYLVQVCARWGASSFARGQYRIACSKNYVKTEEPDTVPTGSIDHDTFAKIVGNTFNPGLDAEDMQAVLKRVSIVVFGRKRVYFRRASGELASVKVFDYAGDEGREIITSKCKDIAYRNRCNNHLKTYSLMSW